MNNVVKILKKLGLSSTEISLYLNGLQFRSVHVAKLVEMGKVKRTTAYHALDTLVEKGLASESKQDGKLQYTMTPATDLKRLLINRKLQVENQLEELEKVIPLFPVPAIALQSIPEVTNYYGTEGIHAAVDRALYCKSKNWRIMAPKDNFFRNSQPEYIAYFKRMRAERDIYATSLWESQETSSAVEAGDIERRKPRIMPSSMCGTFKSTIIIFDQSVLVVSSYNKQFATIIDSQETAETFAVMFDTIWQISKPLC
ncbi:hypothetical protein KBD20_00005 [Candidatus Saccharibacteria bacterium]|nr:hypothetical protein [Candidatus Saccharibacteria bacterium]